MDNHAPKPCLQLTDVSAHTMLSENGLIFLHYMLCSPLTFLSANSAFHPSRVGKRVVIHVITWSYGGVDHQTADQGCEWLFGCASKTMGMGFDCGL